MFLYILLFSFDFIFPLTWKSIFSKIQTFIFFLCFNDDTYGLNLFQCFLKSASYSDWMFSGDKTEEHCCSKCQQLFLGISLRNSSVSSIFKPKFYNQWVIIRTARNLPEHQEIWQHIKFDTDVTSKKTQEPWFVLPWSHETSEIRIITTV